MAYEEIVCAGFGGQGVVFMGRLLVHGGMKDGRNVVGIPSYGAEMRGGVAYYNVIISDQGIDSPIVFKPTVCLVMNQPSLDKFETRMREGGILILNSSLAKRVGGRSDIRAFQIPATQLADGLGDMRCANMVMLGLYARKGGIVGIHSLISSLCELLPKDHPLLRLNERALMVGYEFQP